MARALDGLRHHALMFGAGSGRTTRDDLTALGDELGAIAAQNHLLVVYAGGLVHAKHTDFTPGLTELIRLTARFTGRSGSHRGVSLSSDARGPTGALFVREGIGLVEVVVHGRGRAAGTACARRSGGAGRRSRCAADHVAFDAALLLRAWPDRIQIVGNDLHRLALGSVLGNPGASLQATIHRNEATFLQIVGGELGGAPPRHHIEEVYVVIAGLVFGKTLDGDAHLCHRHARGRVLHLRVSCETPDQDDTIQHFRFSFPDARLSGRTTVLMGYARITTPVAPPDNSYSCGHGQSGKALWPGRVLYSSSSSCRTTRCRRTSSLMRKIRSSSFGTAASDWNCIRM